MSAKHAEAAKQATIVRNARARLTRNLRNGTIDLADILDQPPDYICSMQIARFVTKCVPGMTGQARLARLGSLAVEDGHNLLQPVGRAPQPTLRWLYWRVSNPVDLEARGSHPARNGNGA